MNPDTPSPREDLEAQVTALLLGELPAAEAFALGRAIEQDPELAKLYSRLEKTIGLVRETALNETEQSAAESTPLKLNDERREKLLAHFKTVAPKEFAEPQRARVSWLMPVAAAAIILLLITISLPNFVKSRTTSQSNAIINNLRQIDGAKQQWALEKNKSADDQPSMVDLAPYLRRGPAPIAGETYNVGKMGEPVSADLPTPKQGKWFNSRQSEASESINGRRIQLPGPTEVALADNHTPKSVVTGAALEEEGAKRVARAFSQAPAVSTAAIQNGRIDSGLQPERLIEQNLQNLSQSQKDGKPIPAQAPGQQTDFFTRDSERSLPSKPTTATIALPYAPKDFVDGFADGPALVDGLEKPLSEHSSTNRFIGRYAYLAESKSSILDTTPAPLALPKATVPVTPPVSAATAAGVALPALAGNTGSKDDSGGLVYSFRQRQLTEVEALKAPAEIDKTTSLALAPNSPALETKQRLTEARDKEIFGKDISRGYEITGKSDVAPFHKEAKANELGDVPLLGKQFNGAPRPTESKALGFDVYRGTELVRKQAESQKESLAVPSSNQSLAYFDADAVRSKREQTNVYSFNTVGYSNVTNAFGVTLPNQTIASSTRPVLQYEALNVEREARFKEALKNRGVDARTSLARNGQEPPIQPSQESSRLVPELYGRTNFNYLALKPDNKLSVPLSQEQEAKPKRLLASQGVVVDPVLKGNEKDIASAQKKVDDSRAKLKIQDFQTDQLATDSSDQAKSREPKAPAAAPQPEIQTSENLFSTFSLNVSDVSFKLAAASLEKGQMPEPASVRSEEFINAFDYRDPEPAAGVPVAFAWERARYPFAHNRDLLRFSIKTAAAGRQPGRPLNIVLLLDNSGSMERADRVRIRNEALRVLGGQLQPQDRVSMVTFARTARLCVDGVPGNEAARAMEEVSGLNPQGGTNLEEAMNLAYQTAARHYLANGINRVVLLTDGAANLGDVAPESLKHKVETQRKQGIALDCFGIGWEGFNDDLLEVLSRNGDGRYGFINTSEEAASEFAGQLAGALHAAASDVKVQVEFNPKRVTAYRQIGYAKHQLTKEQFRDNTVDAAEIGAAEAGNALYVIESNAAGEGPIAVLRVRYKIPGTTDYREQEWTVPFTGNAVALEQANPTMRLAATASAFSEWLVSSPYAAEVTPDRLLGYLTGVPEVFGADARPKKLESMIRQAKSVAGK